MLPAYIYFFNSLVMLYIVLDGLPGFALLLYRFLIFKFPKFGKQQKSEWIPGHINNSGSLSEDREQDVAGLLHAEVVRTDRDLGLKKYRRFLLNW
jgi:hypothetical protein